VAFLPCHHVLIFGDFVALTLKVAIFWSVILFSLEVTHQHVGGIYCLLLEGQRISDTAQHRTEQNETEAPQLLKCEEISAKLQ